jgi:hypothetical protein
MKITELISVLETLKHIYTDGDMRVDVGDHYAHIDTLNITTDEEGVLCILRTTKIY